MRLFHMEGYKLLHKKICMIGGSIGICFLVFYFLAVQVGEEQTCFSGVSYQGFAAINKDREIAGEFSGKLTDEGMKEILETYGVPKVPAKNRRSWTDSNYLTAFIVEHFSNADPGKSRPAEYFIPIAESEWRSYATDSEPAAIDFGYMSGFKVFMDLWQMTIVFVCIWVMLMAAPVFSEEKQLKTKALIFTSEKGKRSDTWAKTGAVIFIAVLAYLAVFLLIAVLVGSTYGFSGAETAAGIVLGYARLDSSLVFQPIWLVVLLYLLTGLGGVITTAAITLFASGLCKNTFHTIAAALSIYVLPAFLGALGKEFYHIAIIQPAMTGVWMILWQISEIYKIYIPFVLTEAVVFILAGCWRYVRIPAK